MNYKHIVTAENRRRMLGAVFLDVAKAFDRFWYTGLIIQFLKYGFSPIITRILHPFLEQRTFTVKIEDKISSIKIIEAGVSQGSPLSPVLFNIYTSDIPKNRFTNLSLYADDTLISTFSENSRLIIFRLQNHINEHKPWHQPLENLNKPGKTQAILFGTTKTQRFGNIIINNTPIQLTNAIKYLGLHFDKKLTRRTQISKSKQKANFIISKLYPFLKNRKKSLSNN